MAEKKIIQNTFFQLGQSQNERMPKELKRDFVKIDERTTEDFLWFTQKFSESVNYYRDGTSTPMGHWAKFFPEDPKQIKELLEKLAKEKEKPELERSSNVPPHLALFLTFLELYKKPQEVMNRITGRHLDFYYQEVLRLRKKPAIPDKTHVLIELKKNVLPVTITPTDLFSAGKDKSGVELLYVPTHETVVNTAQVVSLRSIFQDHSLIRQAPIANSADGRGEKLIGDEAKWYGFGHHLLPPAEVGFALASPVLRMKEGIRKVTVALSLSPIDTTKLNSDGVKDSFEVFMTGEKKWLGAYKINSLTLTAHGLEFSFSVPESEAAVINYDQKIHGDSYTTPFPIVKILLKADAALGYDAFKGMGLESAQISVEVANVTSLKLENDEGTLDPKKAFLPFGSQPTVGSRFMVGCEEALSKKLSKLSLMVNWKGVPNALNSHYIDYKTMGAGKTETQIVSGNHYFTATTSFTDNGQPNIKNNVTLFESADASSKHTIFLKEISSPSSTSTPETRDGFITWSLEKDFLHATYRKIYVEKVLKGDKDVLNEPYTPTIRSLSLSYAANSDRVSISSNSPDDFSHPELQFFHLAYFGQMREHSYQRNQFSFITNKAVSLLPQYDNEGELLIGLNNLKGGDSVSVLFQVAEGSADPDLTPENIVWFILCDNYWKPLDRSEVVLDTTHQLLTSGLIRFVIPPEATTTNTILPSGQLWIKAAMTQHVSAVCQLIKVAANAIEVQFKDNGNDPNHLLTALASGKITKLKNGLAVVKTVKQPYASFGGKSVEMDEAFYTRAAERLRHKNRCITAWDYERIILEAFPNVHKVKCIPHAKPENHWLAPGYVLIIVVPDLKNKRAVDILQPKVESGTLSRIATYVQARVGEQVKLAVKNPFYQTIRLDFKVKFRPGYEFNFYCQQLQKKIIEFISPWAFNAQREIAFGGKVYKSVLLDLVEEVEYVDYVTDFKMYSSDQNGDLNEVSPEAPNVILVSDKTHKIMEVA